MAISTVKFSSIDRSTYGPYVDNVKGISSSIENSLTNSPLREGYNFNASEFKKNVQGFLANKSKKQLSYRSGLNQFVHNQTGGERPIIFSRGSHKNEPMMSRRSQ